MALSFIGSRLIVWVAGLVALGHFGENTYAPSVLDPSGLTAPFKSIPLDKLVAAFSHSNGLLILVPLVLLYLYVGPRPFPTTGKSSGLRPRYPLRSDALWLLVVPVGLIGYMGYLWAAHGAPFQPFIAEQRIYHRWFAGRLARSWWHSCTYRTTSPSSFRTAAVSSAQATR